MNAEKFKIELERLMPTVERLESIGFTNNEIINQLRGGYLFEKKIVGGYNFKDPILDIITNYEVSKLSVRNISFRSKDDILTNDKYIFFGNYDSSLLAINKSTNEIVEIDWMDVNYVISHCAASSDQFLDCIIYLERNKGFNSDETLSSNYLCENLMKMAGGEKYALFYKNILEIY